MPRFDFPTIADPDLKVLEQIISTMFHESVMADLLQPQPVYTIPSLRAMFEKVAQCSVMRLNTTSMDKAWLRVRMPPLTTQLFDLMVMVVKFQVQFASPQSLLDVLLNHFHQLETIVAFSPKASETIRSVTDKCCKVRACPHSLLICPFFVGSLFSCPPLILCLVNDWDSKRIGGGGCCCCCCC